MFTLEIVFCRDRTRPGQATLFAERGTELLRPMACLGRAELAKAVKHGNFERSPLRPFGHTPTGQYICMGIHKFHPWKEGYGWAWFPLSATGGDALTAYSNGRSGIGIHGGRGDEELRPTYGCIRLLQRDFDALAEVVGESPVSVTVTEALG